jgi:hypothetical protein
MALDGKHFDAIAVTLALSGSRRRVLGALVGGAFGGLFLRHWIKAEAASEACGVVDPVAIKFGDDFEGGDLPTRWDDVQGLVVEPPVEEASTLDGNWIIPGDTYLARAKSDEAPTYARAGLGTTEGFPELYFRLRFKVLHVIADRGEWLDLLSFRTVNDEPILALGIDELGQLRYRNDSEDRTNVPVEGVGSPVAPTTAELLIRRWHTLQVRLRLADGNGRVEVWYDGAEVPGLSNDEAFGIATIGRIQLGESAPRTKPYDVAFDEVVVATEFYRDCGTGKHCYAGMCVPNDASNCGTGGHVCPGSLSNATVTCDGIGCKFGCNENALDCDGDWENGCEEQQTNSSCALSCQAEPVDCAERGQLCMSDRSCCCTRQLSANCGCLSRSRSARYI